MSAAPRPVIAAGHEHMPHIPSVVTVTSLAAPGIRNSNSDSIVALPARLSVTGIAWISIHPALYTQMQLVPLTAIVSAMPCHHPSAFAHHPDAGTVHQQIQTPLLSLHRDEYLPAGKPY